MFAMLGYQDIIVILVLALLLFGPDKLPEIGKQVGTLLREFRNMTGDMQRSLDLDGTNHFDYDHSYNNRSYTEYTHSSDVSSVVAPAEESKAIEPFAYSAPASGAPVAASAMVAAATATTEHSHESGDAVDHRIASDGARVYEEPVTAERHEGAPVAVATAGT